jgi:hypothetical protein
VHRAFSKEKAPAKVARGCGEWQTGKSPRSDVEAGLAGEPSGGGAKLAHAQCQILRRQSQVKKSNTGTIDGEAVDRMRSRVNVWQAGRKTRRAIVLL